MSGTRYCEFRPSRAARVLTAALALCLLVKGQPAWATETIDKVSVKVSSKLEAGDSKNEDIGIDDKESRVSISVSSKDYSIAEARWTSTSGTLSIGDEPRMIVTLTPTDESEKYFKSTYTGKEIRVSGGEYVSARKSGADLLVTLKVDPVKGSFNPPDDAYWHETTMGKAQWDVKNKQGGAYEVWLYRGKKTVHKEERVRSKTLNLYPYMTEEGVYTFKVRTIPSNDTEKNGKKSDWVESGELVITARDVSDGSKQKGKNEETASTGDTKNAVGNENGWYQRNDAWHYRDSDGNEVRGEWLELGDDWYLMRADGTMLTGWHDDGQYWYYLGGDGKMLTGWQRIAGKWYYFNPSWSEDPIGAAMQGWNIIDGHTYYFNADGSQYKGWLYQVDSWYYLNELEGSLEGAMLKGWIYRDGLYYYTDEYGVMQTGWQEIDGEWYYLDPSDGHKAVDTLVNGFYVDEDGIWREGE